MAVLRLNFHQSTFDSCSHLKKMYLLFRSYPYLKTRSDSPKAIFLFGNFNTNSLKVYTHLYNWLQFIKSDVADSQINCKSIRKNVYCSKLILLQSFYCWKWNILQQWLFIWLLAYSITLLSQCVNSILLICYVIFLYHLNYCFIMSSEICKEYREQWILHLTSYASLEHCVSCKLFNKFFNPIHYVLQNDIRISCGSVHQSAFVYLISMFYNCSTLNRRYIKTHGPWRKQQYWNFTCKNI